jgi:hypothetical protein
MANASGAAQQPGSPTALGESGWIGSKQGNGTTTQQFSASYADPIFGGPITCNGVHQIKKGSAVQDSFTCSLNAGGAWATPPTVGWTAPYGWYSDFDAVQGIVSPLGNMSITSVGPDSNGNVTSYTGLATYTS